MNVTAPFMANFIVADTSGVSLLLTGSSVYMDKLNSRSHRHS